MSEQVQGFKRINFFKGFLTTEKDWNDAERYHIDKRRLHNRMMHSPGIVQGFAGDLRVTARARGDLSVEVQPGYAIDGLGNDLMIHDATIRNISLEEFKLPQTVYIVLRYYEELTHAEIGEAMGLTPAAVKSLLHRALQNVRKEVTP